uniref:Uncharacterized protein n=1 Tax=Parastrongyloides trichosuri TaxID=131310 RepID=A0A0N4ZQ64_PARTI
MSLESSRILADLYEKDETWRILWDAYILMQNRDWVELIAEDELKFLLNNNNTEKKKDKFIEVSRKQKNISKTTKPITIPRSYIPQTPAYNDNNKRRNDQLGSDKIHKTAKGRPIQDRRRYVRQRPELTTGNNNAEKANNINNLKKSK